MVIGEGGGYMTRFPACIMFVEGIWSVSHFAERYWGNSRTGNVQWGKFQVLLLGSKTKDLRKAE